MCRDQCREYAYRSNDVNKFKRKNDFGKCSILESVINQSIRTE